MPTRINKFLASATGMSRRAADTAIGEGRATINGRVAVIGDIVGESDTVLLDGKPVAAGDKTLIMLNKPTGYVCSRQGQGSRTIYELLPAGLANLKPVGRLDKDSSGLLLMTNDGELANQLAHPSYGKSKVYEVRLDKPLEPLHHQMINDHGIQLDDGPSRLTLTKLENDSKYWQVTMSEGRNRQIRRTFASLGYTVTALQRVRLGQYELGDLSEGSYRTLA